MARRKFLSGAEILAPSRHVVDCSRLPDKAIQSAKDDCDINVIVRRFSATGQLPPPNAAPFYGDFEQVDDFHSACNAVIAAKEEFMRLPAAARQRFDNDPGKLIRFLQDDANLDEARELGLCNPKAPDPEPQLVRVVPDPAPPADPPAL